MLSRQYLVITAVPFGDAPLWVREKWIGVSVPLAQSSDKALNVRTVSVLSKTNHILGFLFACLFGRTKRETGFLVESKLAIELLARSSPEAANWWYENTPQLLKLNQYFLFDEQCGHTELVEVVL